MDFLLSGRHVEPGIQLYLADRGEIAQPDIGSRRGIGLDLAAIARQESSLAPNPLDLEHDHGPFVPTDDQAGTDRLWNAVVDNGGQDSACGWCKDKWGLSWQITPRALTAAFTDPDRAAAKRAFDAMMTMRKIDIATIEAARRG